MRDKTKHWIRYGLIFSFGLLIGSAIGHLCFKSEISPTVAQDQEAKEEGYNMENVKMNDLMNWLSDAAGMQYFYNPSLDDSKYAVTGHLNDISNPRNTIDELALAFNLHVQTKGDTLYILTPDQHHSSKKSSFDKVAEQGSADQPTTTRSEPRTEGSQNPQLERPPEGLGR